MPKKPGTGVSTTPAWELAAVAATATATSGWSMPTVAAIGEADHSRRCH